MSDSERDKALASIMRHAGGMAASATDQWLAEIPRWKFWLRWYRRYQQMKVEKIVKNTVTELKERP